MIWSGVERKTTEQEFDVRKGKDGRGRDAAA
jgi:hypothetical protein